MPRAAGSGWPAASVSSLDEAQAVARDVGYPLLIKAVAGGGGRGMKRVNAGRTEHCPHLAMSEAGRRFNDSRVYIERFVASGRHVEVQILGEAKK